MDRQFAIRDWGYPYSVSWVGNCEASEAPGANYISLA